MLQNISRGDRHHAKNISIIALCWVLNTSDTENRKAYAEYA